MLIVVGIDCGVLSAKDKFGPRHAANQRFVRHLHPQLRDLLPNEAPTVRHFTGARQLIGISDIVKTVFINAIGMLPGLLNFSTTQASDIRYMRPAGCT